MAEHGSCGLKSGMTEMLISGSLARLDVSDLRANTHYTGGYYDGHPVIEALWNAVESFTPDEQGAFLRFVTSCSRGPLLGFRHLEPKFCIQKSGTAGSNAPDSTADLERLPTAATCMNLLKLPPYSDEDMVRSKLLYAISAGAGFDLS
ncbi:hypothetical protein CYMTET_41706 [Cymbomonas tetramitiformis]|uniref:HECT-type E3 ubiquitin transferase n=1 Tax=Cymbomonas tetramitiformis TaxID=36881 RepID=A0AAE0F1Z4_9CHLO|nr:hypothetical protein CYMTET_41706 [Cymbomonas tetramitiformis]